MTSTEQAVQVDGDKLMQFVFRAVDEVGGTLNAALVVMSGKLGLYQALAGVGPLSPADPVERAYYAFSTLLCTPASLSQVVGLALGAQAGEARIRDVVTTAGFTRFRRVAETPLNVVYEARP